MKQFDIELNYILNEYLNNIQYLTKFKKTDNKSIVKCDVLICDKEYTLYKYDRGEVLLIPKADKLFDGDFDNVYSLKTIDKKFIYFSITRKKDGIIDVFHYNFKGECPLYDDSSNELLLIRNTVEDYDNKLNEFFESKNVPLELFLASNDIKNIYLPKKNTYAIIRKTIKNTTEMVVYDSLTDCMISFINDKYAFKEINIDENVSYISVINSILYNNQKAKMLK